MLDERVLGQVGVLELVHQHVLEAPGIFLADSGILFQQTGGVEAADRRNPRRCWQPAAFDIRHRRA